MKFQHSTSPLPGFFGRIETLEPRAYFSSSWIDANVGAAVGASKAASAATFTLSLGGSTRAVTNPVGAAADQFHYLYKSLSGDGDFETRLNPVSGFSTEAGVIFRPNLNAGSPFAGITLSSTGVSYETRTAAGTLATATARIAVSGPVYLKLSRDGNSFAGYFSSTGVDGSWTLLGTSGIILPTSGLFGMAVGGTGGQSRATFSAVTLRAVKPLGGNLDTQSDRVQDLPFVDLVKTTRGFYNTAGRKASNGSIAFANTDANGWPTEDFSFSGVDNSEWKVPVDTGTYKMSFSGIAGTKVTGSTGVTVKNLVFNATTKVYTADVVVAANTLKLTLTFKSTGGKVKNIKLFQPGYALSSTQTFTTKYIKLLQTTSPTVLRMMDWTQTNNNLEVNWSDRPKTTDATQAKAVAAGQLQPAKGIAWEYTIQLANQLGHDVWINVPEHASADYITQLATLLRNTLHPDLNIYVEDSNEVWNTGFEQAGYNKTQAVQEVINDPSSNLNYDHKSVDSSKPTSANPNADTWGDRRHARRTKQISDIFKQVFIAGGKADPTNTRVRAVLAGQVSNLSRFDNELTYLSKNYGAPKNYIYGIGVAPYFGLNKYASSTTATEAQVLQGMSSSVDSYVNGASLTNSFNKANAYGLKLIAYEGGPDTYGSNLIAAKKAASLDPKITPIIVRYLNNWYAKGGSLFNWFTIGARSYNSPYGTYTITDSLSNLTSPKIKAFLQVKNS